MERRAARRPAAAVQIEGYWDALRGHRLVPDRAEIDPRALSGALEHAFVLERIAPGLARFRVAGMHLSDLMGLEVRGMPISAIFTPGSRPDLARALDAVFDEPARVRLSLDGEGGIGRPGLSGEMLLLPLRSDSGEVNRALGCLVMEGGLGRKPRRLTVTETDHKTLTGYARGESDNPVQGDLPPEPAPERKRRKPKVPFLRLVHSSD